MNDNGLVKKGFLQEKTRQIKANKQVRLIGTTASCMLLLASIGPASATTERDSIFSLNKTLPQVTSLEEGREGNGNSYEPSISASGRFVAFVSDAENLVADDSNGMSDIFVHDRETGETTRVSVNSDGEQSDGMSLYPSITKNGRYVVFQSAASNLVADDTNGQADIFVHDRETGKTSRVSIDSSGIAGNQPSQNPKISHDGRYIAFSSSATNLVGHDTNGLSDIFVHDRVGGETWLASTDSSGHQADGDSFLPAISPDGQYVAFESSAGNLVPGDDNGDSDIFLHDRKTGETVLVSVSTGGKSGNGASTNPEIGGHNQCVVFQSGASNLVAADNNGLTDVFIRDNTSHTTERVNTTSDKEEAVGGVSLKPEVSDDCNFVAYFSGATNLVENDSNAALDVFVKNRTTTETHRVSVDSAGSQASTSSANPSVSNDGDYIAFDSGAGNLTDPDVNTFNDVFIYHVNKAPEFLPKDQYHCTNSGKQSFELPAWTHFVDDGDYAGERQNLEFKVISVSNSDLFGGELGLAGQPDISWPSHSLHYQPALNAVGSSEVCLSLEDDGLTAHGGKDSSEQCFTIHVDESCDKDGVQQSKQTRVSVETPQVNVETPSVDTPSVSVETPTVETEADEEEETDTGSEINSGRGSLGLFGLIVIGLLGRFRVSQ